MPIVSAIARIVLGLLFTFAGFSAPFMGSPPPLPGIAGTLTMALYQSHWSYAIAFAQAVAGLLLLLNRYVTVALIVLGAFLYNSIAFHALAFPSTLPLPLLVVALWIAACWPYRSQFAELFNAKPRAASRSHHMPEEPPHERAAQQSGKPVHSSIEM